MNELKIKILGKIFEKYHDWTRNESFFCHRGCSLCCTQKVMITAVEGQYIYKYILNKKMERWFTGKLLTERQAQRINLTTNGFARVCLEKKEEYADEEQTSQHETCPFLEENCCKIYEVRPFMCRSFASDRDCRDTGSAYLNEIILVINTVTMQLVEHLGQKEYWGNMLDVLLSLAQEQTNCDVKKYISDDEIIKSAETRTLTAEPIPGFLLKPGEENEITQYLTSIFSENIGAKTVEEIFNNKCKK